MEAFKNWFFTPDGIAITVLIVLFLVMLVMLLEAHRKINYVNRRFKKLNGKLRDKEIEEVLLEYYDYAKDAQSTADAMDARITALEEKLPYCVQSMGLIRYNAFPDMGSDLSFALALIDENANGCVMNSVYGRETFAMYIKPLVKGDSQYHLSDEEKGAVKAAVKRLGRKDA